MVLTAEVVGTPVATLTVEVTASDITVPLVFNITVTDGQATGTLKLPPGDARHILVRAYDSLGTITHEGSLTIDVLPGVNPATRIPMRPAAGHVTITVQLGPVSIELYTDATLDPGATAWANAFAYDGAGLELRDCIVWATSDPTVLTVSVWPWDSRAATVTGVSPGTALVVATCAGVARTASVTVNDWLVAGNATAFTNPFWICVGADYALASPVSVATAMTVRQLGFFAGESGDSMRLALYRDDAGAPGALVAGTDFSPVSAGKNALPVSPTAIEAGDYWLAFEGRGYTERGACVLGAPSDVSTRWAQGSAPSASAWPATLTTYVGDWSTTLNLFVEGQPTPTTP